MPKQKSHLVRVSDPSTATVVGTISLRDIEERIRKPFAPPSRMHESKKAYRRKEKFSRINEE